MLVFIDESGDPGFKLAEGSSPYFVAAMVIFDDKEKVAATQQTIADSAARKVHKGEFKFSKVCNDVRDLFCHAVRSCEFSVQAIVVKKDLIYSPRLMTNKDQFYEYL